MKQIITLSVITLCLLAAQSCTAQITATQLNTPQSLAVQLHAASDLYISEYIEGSGYNKALEFYNSSAASIDLAAYEVQFYFNGSLSAGHTINLTGNIAPGGVFVLSHASADATLLALSNQSSAGSWFNGDDVVVLLNAGNSIDVIGQIGLAPGIAWSNGSVSTANKTLRRLPTVESGDTDGFNSFDVSLEWTDSAQDSFDDLGKYISSIPTPTSQLLINEVDADTTGADKLEFIELFDGGTGNVDLSPYVMVLYNGNTNLSYASFSLQENVTNAAGFFVMGNSAVNGVDLIIPDGLLQNGADAVALYQSSVTDFPNASAVSTLNLVDAVVYGTNDAPASGLLPLLNLDQPQLNEAANNNKDTDSNQRCLNGAGGLRNTSSFIQATATPGQINTCVINTNCGTPATLIHTIQGSTDISPLLGQVVTTEAVVVGDFQNTLNGLSGFFLQEETTDSDTDPLTSEGLFVYDSGFGTSVNTGDVVRVTGTIAEHFGLTELNTLTSIEICATGARLPATAVSLPFTDNSSLEAFESMLIHLPQTLTVTENHGLGRYGEVVVSSAGRLFTPTNIVKPGASAIAMQAANDLNRLVIDDGNAMQNPDPIIYPALPGSTEGLSASNTLRNGDQVTGLTGVVAFTANAYRVHPTQTPLFVANNPRTPAPVLPGTGNLRVASFNVLNYFNGDGLNNGLDGGFPTARGAHTATEFTRQRDKIIAAISAMQADIIGLMELENDGYSSTSAIEDLLNGLNIAAPAGTSYSFVNPGVTKIGNDEITVGFIYRQQTVQLTGNAAILNSSIDARFNDLKNRPTLVQTFTDITSGARLTIAVNHLKSKGSSCATIGDPDLGDGQGNCNLTRRNAASALVDWLATDPTQSNDPDFLIIGDLNAYAKEDPLRVIQAAGYTNLITTHLGTSAYSYNFMGQSGNLDHALASPGLSLQVTGITDWHINADEPTVLDYNEELKSLNQLNTLYNPDAYRASDHDPIVIELNLN